MPPSARFMHKTSFSGARVLIVDDEDTLRYTLRDLFRRVGYDATCVASGLEALALIREQTFDVILLDLKMPGMDGVELLERARPHATDTIFIIMTAYGTLDSAIVGIRQGAYDYLLKPSSLKTLLNTVEAGLLEREEERQRHHADDPIDLLERALNNLKQEPDPATTADPSKEGTVPQSAPADAERPRFLRAADLLVDLQKNLVLLNNTPVHLTKTEYDILIYLMQHRNRVVTPETIVRQLRDYKAGRKEASAFLRSHIHRLRGKIEPDPANPKFVKTVRGRGYRFDVVP